MPFTFKCDYCGAEVTRDRRRGCTAHSFCGYMCAARWRVANGKVRSFPRDRRGNLPHEDVHIKVLRDIALFPEFQPAKGSVYAAEKYFGQQGGKNVGYVISVNGHRVNIRENECMEV